MRSRKTELLAPAGNFACFRAAINAGADAVYLGGERFGARAYADNFSQEEIVQAIQIAHIFDRKIYLTVNTLVKENEIAEVVPYLTPFYEAGLDGVIVQDIGVLRLLNRYFPEMALHASTQMTITGSYGAAYMKQLGVCRVVPARELSLKEIKAIKENTGLEIECFVHGAMCYSYSGQCLFSSVLGGRSGNRGRCAGPCRLAYTDEKGRTSYPLSLKDLYTLSILPELIDAGIDSFKIEGRMKSAEYVAGVTAIYRKYLDQCLLEPNRPYQVDPSDEALLKGLYVRSTLCSGYYHRQNGRQMVTLGEGGYSGSSQAILDNIRTQYIAHNAQLAVTGHACIYAGRPASFTLSCNRASVTVTGAVASAAKNKPLCKTDLLERLCKTGDTCFRITEMEVETDNASFMPVSSLNELRRNACAKLMQELARGRQKAEGSTASKPLCLEIKRTADSSNILCVLAATMEQLQVIHSFAELNTIYVNADLFLSDSLTACKKNAEQSLLADRTYFLTLPHILRKRSYKYLGMYEHLLKSGYFNGALARNFEELEWLREIGYQGKIVTDYTLYTWNNETLAHYAGQVDKITQSLELNRRELSLLDTRQTESELVIYGYLPLMYSANCIKNTLEKCSPVKAGEHIVYHLTDRYQNVFCVVPDCVHCYNILYNTLPLSLHGQMDSIIKKNYTMLRMDFSIEDAAQTRKVIAFYLNLKKSSPENSLPFRAYTNGHYKRGVE